MRNDLGEGGLPFSTGKLGGEFVLLKAYIEEAGGAGLVPGREVFDLIQSLAASGSPAEEVIEAVAERVAGMVDAQAAVKAYRKVFGIDTHPEEAVRAVAREAAAWVIEMAETLGVIRIRGYTR